MRLPILSILTATVIGTALNAQTRVTDVGMTMDLGSVLPAFVGYDCGPFSCPSFDGGFFGRGSVRTFTVYGAPQTPYVLAVAAPAACRPIAGVGNALLLATPATTLRIGTTGPRVPGLNCNQGMDTVRLTMPGTAPQGLQLRFQHVGVSASGRLAFGPAFDSVVW